MTPAARFTDWPSRLARRIESARARQQLVRDFERLMQDADVDTVPGGPVVGFATFGSGGWHFTIEALLAHALRLRGARPAMLICDMPELPVCDERSIQSNDLERCAGCIDDKRELIEASQLPWVGIRELVPDDAIDRARAAATLVPAGEIDVFHFNGWPIGQWLHVSASHFLRGDARGASPEKIEAKRRQLAAAIVAVTAVERWLDRVAPSIVIAESGAHLVWRVALELARARGIPVICREMGKGGWDVHLYSLNRDCMSPDLDTEWSRVKDQPLTPDEAAAVGTYIAELPKRTYGGAGQADRPRPDLRQRLGIGAGSRIAAAFTNVTWDLATAGRDAGFTGVLDWVCETIACAAGQREVHLIVRAHPAEASVKTREKIVDQITARWPVLPTNVTLLGPEHDASALEVCDVADVVLVYNSTAGLEAAARGTPVLVAGAPHYRGKGFTHDVMTREEYRAILAQWATGAALAPPPHAAELARRYGHLFFLRYHVPMGWTTSPIDPPFELTIRSIDELAPGHNPALDRVCAGILEGRQILLPRESTLRAAPCAP